MQISERQVRFPSPAGIVYTPQIPLPIPVRCLPFLSDIDIFLDNREYGVYALRIETIDFVRSSVSGLARDGIYEGVTRPLVPTYE
jgi:hypothetical protein